MDKEFFKFNSVEEFCQKIKNYFNKDRKFIFLITIICGILSHFLLFTNLIFSQDGILNTFHYTAGDYELSLGRWGINIFDSLRNNIGLPFITTAISMVLLAFTNILLIELFEIKNSFFKILTVLSIVVSPCICMTLLYTYTADVYCYAMFFSVFTVYAFYKIKNKKIGNILGIISFVFMLSIYQSYMGFSIGLILMLTIKKLIEKENSTLEVIKDIFFIAMKLIFSAIIYYITTKILLETRGMELSGYGGLSQISLFAIFGSFFLSIKEVYLGFIKYFFADGVVLNRTWNRDKLYLYFYILSVIAGVILIIKQFINAKNKRDIFIRTILIFILLICLPIGLNIVLIMAPGNQVYYLTATQMLLMIPFCLMIFEKLDNNRFFENILTWGISIITATIMLTYCFSVIVTYQTAVLSFKQAETVSNRILERMEETPGYRSGMNKLFAGVIDDINFPKTLDLYNYTVTNSLRSSILHGMYFGQEITWRNFFNMYLGIPITFCTDYEYYTIITSDEFKSMGVFPAEDSVKIINDVMVVKFTNTPQYPPITEEMLEKGIVY